MSLVADHWRAWLLCRVPDPASQSFSCRPRTGVWIRWWSPGRTRARIRSAGDRTGELGNLGHAARCGRSSAVDHESPPGVTWAWPGWHAHDAGMAEAEWFVVRCARYDDECQECD